MSPERDLIQRLADELQVWIDNAECEIFPDEQALIDEARACLAQTELRGDTTPKPQVPPGRVLGPDGETIGYRSIPSPRKP